MVLLTHGEAGRRMDMPRKLRVELAGALYHVLNRGDRRQDICRDDRDGDRFLATRAETCAQTG